jgi:phosphoribosylformimino-5-aminoimidazole carboxamide ribotide isomerase
MILIVPEIRIVDGVCSYCIKGEDNTYEFYSHLASYPNELCKLLRVENSKSIFVNDMDSFNNENHYMNYDAIIELAKTIDSPFQVMTNFKTFEECSYLIHNRIRRIVIKDVLFNNPSLVKDLIHEYSPSCFAFYLKNKNNKFHDGTKDIRLSPREVLNFIKGIGGNRIFYSNDDWYTKKEGIETDEVIEYANQLKFKITLMNGIYHSQQLWDLEKLAVVGVDSIVLGEAMYNNYFPCQKIWRMVEADDKNLELTPVSH